MKEQLSYGVNIDIANETKKEMAETLKTDNKNVLNKVGAFASLYNFNFPNYKEPVLVLKTEEPGSKQLLAAKYGKLENISYDMINHLINDCIVMGATPLTVQDAIICGKINKDDISALVKTMADACKKQGCVLTGGETSEQPGVITDGTYILTSSIVGVVEKSKIIDGSKIQKGDVVIGVTSSGIHTNGYTLVRKIMDTYPEVLKTKADGKDFIDAVLEPHMCYYKIIKDLFDRNVIKGLAHITGGGIKENLNRILPDNIDANIDLSKYKVLDIFKLIKNFGNVSDEEMLRTFNMGVGLAIVANQENAEYIMNHIFNQNVFCSKIGTIVEGTKKVNTFGKINW